MMAGRNSVTDDGAGSNWMGGVERDQRNAVAGHAGNIQSLDHAIVAIFQMYTVPGAVCEHQIVEKQIMRRVAVLLVRIDHATRRNAVSAAKLEIL